MTYLGKIEKWVERIESWVFIVILLGMIGLGTTQIVLRNFFQTGFIWTNLAMRHLFFIIGFLGALLATKEGSHLAMDLASRLLPEKIKKVTDIIINLISCVATALLAKFSYEYVLIEKGAEAFLPNLDFIPTYWAYAIIPIGFGLISLRFLLNVVSRLQSASVKEMK